MGRLFSAGAPNASPDNLRKAVDIYVRNVELASAICPAEKMQCFFVLQPVTATKEGLAPVEKRVFDRTSPEAIAFIREYYAQVRRQMAARPCFIDASGILNNNGRDDFYDGAHTSAFSGAAIGGYLGKRVLELREKCADATRRSLETIARRPVGSGLQR
jgi:hypothetical protein